ncbi:MAG: cobyric acid synthase [Halarsenatibacteraceae bacterium]
MSKNAMAVMVQGTSSNVGKSLIAAALCKIYSQQGLKTAPFKAWNMSSNSYLTEEGIKIGIGQAVQAIAAGYKPDSRIQPVLVKPIGSGKNQVFLNGKDQGQFKFGESDKNLNKKITATINENLNKLMVENDLVILEGSGSPAELNRVGPDFGNMFTARLKTIPVLLTADISRGGALADIVGTLKLLSERDRSLVRGLLINKFRGDYNLLKPGLQFLEDYTAKPVLGVLPYLDRLNLPEEDTSPRLQLDQSSDLSYLDNEIKKLAAKLKDCLKLDKILELARRDNNG